MLYKLDQTAYARVTPLFQDRDVHLDIDAVLCGDCPGTVYADDVDNPRTACIVSGDGYYVDGATDNAAFNAALNALFPRDEYFCLYCDFDRWGDVLDDLLVQTYAVPAGRSYLRLGELTMPDWQDHIPDGYDIRAIDRDLLSSNLEGTDDLVEGILETWRSVERFLDKGFGYCVVHHGEIVSHCNADFGVDDRSEVGVGTSWGHRRKGLATLAAAATVSRARDLGLIVGWHCWSNNVGSLGVARKVGFVLDRMFDVCISHWAAENVSDMTRDEFRSFAQNHERLFQLDPPQSGYPHIVAATAWSLADDVEECFRQLHQAVDIGWLCSADQLREVWPEFFFIQHLDQTDEWAALEARLQ